MLSKGHTAMTILICHISGMTPIPVPSTIIVVRQIAHKMNVHLNCLKMMGISVKKLTLPSASFDVAPQDLECTIRAGNRGNVVKDLHVDASHMRNNGLADVDRDATQENRHERQKLDFTFS